ncbi:MAG: copper resistance protein CopC [Acidimicrobiales bacterium]
MSARSRLAAAGALAVAAIVLPASAASAHAVLLRSEPAPQTTVPRAPAVVRLYFSEPVEVAFGAIRVYDVDGHRVDDGGIQRAEAGREVDVPARMKNGTYTVTWRVTSADGHPVHGGFGFYVGAPSTISPAAIPADRGAGRTVGWGYGVVRFVWFAGLIALIGLVAVRRWVWTPAMRAAGLARSDAASGFRRRFRRWLPAAWAVLAAAGLLALVFQTATVSGLSLVSAARPAALGQVLHTAFGRLWLAEMVLTAAALAPVLALVGRRRALGLAPDVWIGVLGALAGGLCLTSALNGHARTLGRAAVDVPALAVHLLAAGVWVGGLGALVAVGAASWRAVPDAGRPALVRDLTRRFGRLALVAAGVVVVTGVVNAFGDFSTVSDLWRVSHGRVVTAKVAALAVALALAARHRWSVPARLEGDGASAGAAVASFRRTAAAEVAALVAALALAAALVALVPGRSLALAAKGPVNQEHRAGPYTAELFIDPTDVGANQVHLTFVNASGLAAAEVSNTDVSLGPAAGPLQPVSMRLISPGHFVGDTTLGPGPYRLTVTAGGGSSASTTFTFRLAGSQPKP